MSLNFGANGLYVINTSGRNQPIYDFNNYGQVIGTLYPNEIYIEVPDPVYGHRGCLAQTSGKGWAKCYPILPDRNEGAGEWEYISLAFTKATSINGNGKFVLRRSANLYKGTTFVKTLSAGAEIVLPYNADSVAGATFPERINVQSYRESPSHSFKVDGGYWLHTGIDLGYSMKSNINIYGA